MTARPDLMAKLEKIVDVDASLAAGHLIAKSDREPTQDEKDGMAWWNALNGEDRRMWLERAGNTGRAADAWAAYKADPSTWYPQRRCSRCDRELVQTPSRTYIECACPPVDDLAILRENRDAQQRAVDEVNSYIVSAEDSLIIGAVVDMMTENQYLFAIRFLRLERQVEELRQQFDASTLGAYASAVQP